jgi:hypothetical protein
MRRSAVAVLLVRADGDAERLRIASRHAQAAAQHGQAAAWRNERAAADSVAIVRPVSARTTGAAVTVEGV